MNGRNTTGTGEEAQVPEKLLSAGEVAAMFGVESRTVGRWANSGKLTAIKKPGWRWRKYRESEVRALLDGTDTGLDGEG